MFQPRPILEQWEKMMINKSLSYPQLIEFYVIKFTFVA